MAPGYADFTEAEYLRLLKIAREQYQFLLFEEAASVDRGVLWRHDLDTSVHRAAALARLESREGVRATYCVWLHSPFYNVLEYDVASRLREIAAMGHDVGLHFDPMFYRLDPDDRRERDRRIRQEASVLETILDLPVKTVALHNPGIDGWLEIADDTMGGMRHTCGASIRSQFVYCSDSTGEWRYQPLEQVLTSAAPRLQVLTHPEWWVPEPMSPRERIARAIEGRASRTASRYDAELVELRSRT